MKDFYSQYFEEVIKFADENSMYIGTGNPNADILIIGKEAAISMAANNVQYNQEIQLNAYDWLKNIENKTQHSDVISWFEKHPPQYNPFYPYKNQLNTIEMRNSQGEIIRGHSGTSKTWHNYQKLTDYIYNNGIKSSHVNFHEYTFSSELNQVTGKYSKDVPRIARMESIQKRKELFNLPFFKQFPITIIAVGHYIRDFEIDLQKMFHVTFNENESQIHSRNMGSEYINIHYGIAENSPKILIHTNQLSMVSNELINRLAVVCKEFLILNVGLKEL